MYDTLEREELRKLLDGKHWNVEDVATVFGEMLQNCPNISCKMCPFGYHLNYNGDKHALMCHVVLDYRKKSKTNS